MLYVSIAALCTKPTLYKMDKFDRIYQLHTIFSNSRYPVSKKELQTILECSHATIERTINTMRLYLDAPILYDRNANGYYYDTTSKQHYQLPGLWFNASELYALLTTYQLLSDTEPGLLEQHIAPLKEKITRLLHNKKAGDQNIANRIRILKMAARQHDSLHFSTIASATIDRKQLAIRYHGRARNQETSRIISPQRLVHYRDNWYLDAWCHTNNGFRNFSIDRLLDSKTLNKAAKHINNNELDRHYASAYGIFAGEPEYIAVLIFSKNIARWIANEQWHPKQLGQHEADGRYTLQIPYSHPQELIMDTLKYGADVEVKQPVSLRKAISDKHKAAYEIYRAKQTGD